MRKNVFINKLECLNVVKDWKIFLIIMENFKSYIIKFEKNDKIKPKIYLLDCAFGKSNQQLIIIITYNK